MKREERVSDYVYRVAGAFVIISLALGIWVSRYWLLFTTFVGLNLFQASFTGFCPVASLLRKAGIRD